MLLLLIIFIALVAVVCFYFLTGPFRYWSNKNVPHPPVSYLFGNIGAVVCLKKSLGQVYSEIYNQYPSLPYLGFYKSRTPCIMIRDLELVKEVLVKNFNSFSDNDIQVDEKMDPLFAKNPFAAKGNRWKETRNQITPLYTTKRIKEVYPLIDAVAKNMVKYINTEIIGKAGGVEAKSLCEKYTTDVVASCALGLEGNSFLHPKSEYIRMWKKILSPSFLLHIKLLLLFLSPSFSRIIYAKFIPDEVSDYFKTVVNKTLKYRTQNKIQRGDFLDAMVELKNKIGEDNFTNEDVTAHVAGFFIDGTESSSIVLSFVLYELGLHPDIQAKLKSEIDNILQENDGKLSYDAIQQIVYLDQIINESLRKNSTSSIISRVCTTRFCLQPPDESAPKIIIEPGTPVVISVDGIHNDAKYYKNPHCYDPTRFSNENKEKHRKFSFLPFGEGPRTCLGQRFGLIQVKIALVNLIMHFEIKLNKKTEVPYQIDPHYLLLAAKEGIWLDFHKRV